MRNFTVNAAGCSQRTERLTTHRLGRCSGPSDWAGCEVEFSRSKSCVTVTGTPSCYPTYLRGDVLAYRQTACILVKSVGIVGGMSLHQRPVAAPEIVGGSAPGFATAGLQRKEVGDHAGLRVLLGQGAVV